MNTPKSTADPAIAPELFRRFEPLQPTLCTLPDFVKIPAVPGLPTELTGVALRNALQARAQSIVSRRHS